MESLTFKLSNGRYAAPLHLIDEVLPMIAIQAIPDLPSFIAGGINLRGEILPVIDLVERLGADWPFPPSIAPPVTQAEANHLASREANEQTKYTNKSRLLIVQQLQYRYAVILNGVEEIIDFADANACKNVTIEGVQAEYLQGMVLENNDIIHMIYINKILSEAELSQLNTA